jgi:hypothetical protein
LLYGRQPSSFQSEEKPPIAETVEEIGQIGHSLGCDSQTTS